MENPGVGGKFLVNPHRSLLAGNLPVGKKHISVWRFFPFFQIIEKLLRFSGNMVHY